MKSATTIFWVLTLFVCASCESPEKTARRRAQWEQNIEQARFRVLQQLPNLDNDSREMIRTNRPSIPYAGAPFGGDYWFWWTISSNRAVELNAFTMPENVSNAPVRILQRVSDSNYGAWKEVR